MKRIRIALLFLSGILLSLPTQLHAAERRVVVIIWPGLTPDMIAPENTPTLCQLIQHGTNFTNHHALFPSAVNTNLAAIVTGTYPDENGLLTDNEFRPDIEPLKPVTTGTPSTIESGDIVSQHTYLKAPTLAEVLGHSTPPLRTITAGTDVNTLLTDRKNRAVDLTGILLAAGNTLPTNAVEPVDAELGLYPSVTGNNKTARDTWTTAALTEVFWKDGLPSLSILVLAEPAYTAITKGPDNYAALEAISLADGKLAMILAALQKYDLLQDTDVLLLSTQGTSKTARHMDTIADLNKLGIPAKTSFITPPKQGAILVVPNGGMDLIYVTGHDSSATLETVAALQKLDYAGVIFTKDGIEGTFPLTLAHLDTPDAPDIVFTHKWEGAHGTSPYETPSTLADQGTTGSLNPREMKSVLVAYGPDFATGKTSETPSGNTDIAPTILWLLGLEIPPTMKGRVLSEALNGKAPSQPQAESKTHHAQTNTPGGTWAQYLKTSTIGTTIYIDEGNATLTPATRTPDKLATTPPPVLTPAK